MSEVMYYYIDEMYSNLHAITREMHLKGYHPEHIVGVLRGGAVPAVFLSHYFNVPVTMITVSFRDNAGHDNQVSIELLDEIMHEHTDVLVVDDICDSGKTFEFITSKIAAVRGKKHHLRTLALVHNEGQNVYTPDFTGMMINKVEDPRWIVFPWEHWWQV